MGRWFDSVGDAVFVVSVGVCLLLFLGCESLKDAGKNAGKTATENLDKTVEKVIKSPLFKDAVKVQASAVVDAKVNATVTAKLLDFKKVNNIGTQINPWLWAKNVGMTNEIFSGGAGALMIVCIVLILVNRRKNDYKTGLLSLQRVVKNFRDPALVECIKPVVKATGSRAKKVFDRLLNQA